MYRRVFETFHLFLLFSPTRQHTRTEYDRVVHQTVHRANGHGEAILEGSVLNVTESHKLITHSVHTRAQFPKS